MTQTKLGSFIGTHNLPEAFKHNTLPPSISHHWQVNTGGTEAVAALQPLVVVQVLSDGVGYSLDTSISLGLGHFWGPGAAAPVAQVATVLCRRRGRPGKCAGMSGIPGVVGPLGNYSVTHHSTVLFLDPTAPQHSFTRSP